MNIKKSIKLRLTITVTTMILILFVLNGIISSRDAKQNFQGLSDNIYIANANYNAAVVDNWFASNKSSLETLAAYVESGAVKQEDLQKAFVQFADNNDSVTEVYLGKDDNSYVFAYYKPDKDYKISEREWYLDTKKADGVYCTEPYMDTITGKLCISMCMQCAGGVLGMDLDLDSLIKTIPEIEQGYVFLATANGDLIVHGNSDYTISGNSPENINSMIGGAYKTAMEDDDLFEDYDGTPSYITAAEVPTNGWTLAIVTPKSTYDAPINSMINIYVILTIVFCIVAAVIIIIISNNITNPIISMTNKINEIVESIREGRGDLTIRVNTKSVDEIGLIGQGVDELMEELEDLIPQAKDASSTVYGRSEELVGITQTINNAVSNISQAVEDIANGATQQASDVMQASENVENIGQAIDGVAGITEELNGIAKDMKKSSMDTENQLENLQESTDAMVSGISAIEDQIKNTSDAVDIINEKVSAITEIASETNLLSLNASIEAARAGEMGRGFAVVAEEIGKLAVDSAASADSIRVEMQGLLNSSQAAVEESVRVHDHTIKQQKVLASTTQTIQELLKQIEATIDYIARIESDMSVCVEAKTVILDAMNSLSAISEENAASSEETSATTTEIIGAVENLSGSASELNDVANELNGRLSIFE